MHLLSKSIGVARTSKCVYAILYELCIQVVQILGSMAISRPSAPMLAGHPQCVPELKGASGTPTLPMDLDGATIKWIARTKHDGRESNCIVKCLVTFLIVT